MSNAENTPVQQHTISFAHKTSLISCSVDKVNHIIQQLFKDLLGPHTSEEPISTYKVQSESTGITVYCGDNLFHTEASGDLVEVANVLMNNIKRDLLNPIQNHLVLHAALVSFQGHSILLPGNSGNGKSLATLGMLAQGCEYHTDEVVLLNASDNNITPFVRPLMIKPHGLDAATELLGAPINDIMVYGRSIISLPFRELEQHFQNSKNHDKRQSELLNPPPIHTIIFPKYDAGSAGELTPFSPALTMIELFKNNVVARNLPDLGTSALKQLAQNTSAFELRYASYEQLPNLFAQIRSELL